MTRAGLVGLSRLVHPFPSLLNAAITGVLVIVAGAPVGVALRLALSMAAFQFSIGAHNDLVDAPIDAGRGDRKPIPAGLVTPGSARVVAAAGFLAGTLLAVPSGVPVAVVGVLGVAMGYAYNVRLQGTIISWVPLSIGIPLLPVFAWLGAGEPLPAAFAILLPAGALAGAGLAIGNALADLERDLAAGVVTVATRLGPDRAWAVHAGLHLAVVAIAAGGARLLPGGSIQAAAWVLASGLVVFAGVLAARRGSARRREIAWEVEAVATGLLGVTWLLAAGDGGSL